MKKYLSEYTNAIGSVSSAQSSLKDLTIDQNFQELSGAINQLETAFGIKLADPFPEFNNSTQGQVFLNLVKSNLIQLPATGPVKIGLDGNNGGITGASINVTNNAFVGGDIDLYNKNGTGGRVRFRVDRNSDITKTPIPGQIRFNGNNFQGYIFQGEVASSFNFVIVSCCY